jgi:Isochorismatase family
MRRVTGRDGPLVHQIEQEDPDFRSRRPSWRQGGCGYAKQSRSGPRPRGGRSILGAAAPPAKTEGAHRVELFCPSGAEQRVNVMTSAGRSDLDVVLRSLGVESLVLTGIATSGVVLSTLREAADLDFTLTVLSDGCLDHDAEVHRILMDKVFPRQASVMSAVEWKAQISASTTG